MYWKSGEIAEENIKILQSETKIEPDLRLHNNWKQTVSIESIAKTRNRNKTLETWWLASLSCTAKLEEIMKPSIFKSLTIIQ